MDSSKPPSDASAPGGDSQQANRQNAAEKNQEDSAISPERSPASEKSRKLDLYLVLSAIVLSALSVLYPALALPALALLVLAAAQSSGKLRLLGILVSTPLLVISSMLFLLHHAAPGIVESGRRAAESKAVARLRELHWAQDRARLDKVCDFDGDGAGDYAFIGDLTGVSGRPCAGGTPLRTTSFHRITQDFLSSGVAHGEGSESGEAESNPREAESEGGGSDSELLDAGDLPSTSDAEARNQAAVAGEIYRGDGFNYVLYLPDSEGNWRHEGEEFNIASSPRRWIAFAWPATEGAALRSYFIDQDERICETLEERVFATHQIPPPESGPITQWEDCEGSPAGVKWQAWKGKKPRKSQESEEVD